MSLIQNLTGKAKLTAPILSFVFLLCLSNNLYAANASALNNNTELEIEADLYDEDYYDMDYNPSPQSKKINVWDPWEKMNRKIYEFNEFILTYLAKPLYYEVYTKITTPGMRKSVGNIVSNLKLPMMFFNYVLQLDFRNAMKTLYSFAINSTYGILGIYDVSGHQNTTPSPTDLGVTLARYGVPAGPYIVLPLLGPSNLRNTLSRAAEIAIDPLGYNVTTLGGKSPLVEDWFLWTRSTLYVIDNVSFVMDNMYDLIEASFDPYIMMRDAYGQSQQYKINKKRGQ